MAEYLELDKANKDKEQELLARELELREKAISLAQKSLERVESQLLSGSSVKAANYALVYAALTGASVTFTPQEPK